MAVAALTVTAFLFAACLPIKTTSFSAAPIRTTLTQPKPRPSRLRSRRRDDDGDDVAIANPYFRRGDATQTRRSVLQSTVAVAVAATAATIAAPERASAALGTLPEFSDANAALQSLTIDVADVSQYDETIEFFTSAFDGMRVLRQRNGRGGAVREAWLGFGPETLSIPPDFTLPVSSLSQYGGHAALHIRYDPKSTSLLYKRTSGEINNAPAPGDNIAYLQLGVLGYRISQMSKHGGNVLDAYGWVNVVSPAGLPVRGIIGVRADPIMFLAVNCVDVGKSEEFYTKLGFVRQEYPYARLNQGQGQFEPPQPSKSVYVAPSPNSMGILLLPSERRGRNKGVTPNPVLRSLNVVYAPPEGSDDGGSGSDAGSFKPQLVDPSSVPISFITQDYLEREIKMTATPQST